MQNHRVSCASLADLTASSCNMRARNLPRDRNPSVSRAGRRYLSHKAFKRMQFAVCGTGRATHVRARSHFSLVETNLQLART
jgi:hypothetical protein